MHTHSLTNFLLFSIVVRAGKERERERDREATLFKKIHAQTVKLVVLNPFRLAVHFVMLDAQ